MQQYSKAIAAAVTPLAVQAVVYWLNANGYTVTPELNAALTTIATAFFVWLVPNVARLDDIVIELARRQGVTPEQVFGILAVLDDIKGEWEPDAN